MKPIQKAILVGIITIVIYLLVVVATTPALTPLDAISAVFQLNSIVIIGMGQELVCRYFYLRKARYLVANSI